MAQRWEGQRPVVTWIKLQIDHISRKSAAKTCTMHDQRRAPAEDNYGNLLALAAAPGDRTSKASEGMVSSSSVWWYRLWRHPAQRNWKWFVLSRGAARCHKGGEESKSPRFGLGVLFWFGNYNCMKPDNWVSEYYDVKTRPENLASELYYVRTNLLIY